MVDLLPVASVACVAPCVCCEGFPFSVCGIVVIVVILSFSKFFQLSHTPVVSVFFRVRTMNSGGLLQVRQCKCLPVKYPPRGTR